MTLTLIFLPFPLLLGKTDPLPYLDLLCFMAFAVTLIQVTESGLRQSPNGARPRS